MRVLVTGAAGFIGGQLWHALWKRGDEVVGIDNFSYGNLDNLKFEDHDFGPEVRRMDIRDREAIPALFEAEKFDVVYNIAGIAPLPDCQSDPVQAVEVNTLGLVHLLECARRTGVKQLVQASTNAMYENETQFPTVENSFNPPTLIYPNTKYCAEYLHACEYKEFFVSGIYNVLAAHGAAVRGFATDLHLPFGTPDEYRTAEAPENAAGFEALL